MVGLKPMFPYYGSKATLAPRYPAPRFDTVVEPFAGSACYSLLHYDRRVILLDSDPVVAGLWEFLIRVSFGAGREQFPGGSRSNEAGGGEVAHPEPDPTEQVLSGMRQGKRERGQLTTPDGGEWKAMKRGVCVQRQWAKALGLDGFGPSARDLVSRPRRGKAVEELAEAAARTMAEQGRWLLVRVPTEVVVHRSGVTGAKAITGAHYKQRAVADFLGMDNQGRSIVVEVKSSEGKRIRLLSREGVATPSLPAHQRAFLDRCLEMGAAVFLLVAFGTAEGFGPLLASAPGRALWYLIPWRWARIVDALDESDPEVAKWKAPYLFLEAMG